MFKVRGIVIAGLATVLLGCVLVAPAHAPARFLSASILGASGLSLRVL